ncbi:MAG: YciI family protein [Rhodospirillales bacterium]
MKFALICTDKPQSLPIRLATREAHVAYLETYADKLLEVGPLLDPDGRPCGSLLIIEVEDAAAAAGFAEADPYAKAGLFESVLIRGYRTVFRDGELAT